MSPLRLSVVTPSYDQGLFLEQTLCSVLDQGYPALEYVVIDGGSRDATRDILERYGPRLSYWESEADRGQVHAINKGLVRAKGEIIAFLNSDDVYLPGALSAVGDYFERHPQCRWLCGDTILFGAGEPTRLVRAQVPRSIGHCLAWSYTAPQPGMFWRRELLEGGFDERWRYCFDHEMYARLLVRGERCEHLALPVAAYRLHPSSKTVRDARAFDEEFDAIAQIYEARIRPGPRRWSASTRALRRSHDLARHGKRGRGWRALAEALWIDPRALARRPLWGCLRQLLGPQGER